ncbi:uncharacterized protein LOC134438332 [Engraulis encrasicolus]|uniref:uncharacterized protein LOC134438332 n=1 Tax=Engraulis encrasicolus TaxID=184585 RepID=UPI002FD0E05D
MLGPLLRVHLLLAVLCISVKGGISGYQGFGHSSVKSGTSHDTPTVGHPFTPANAKFSEGRSYSNAEHGVRHKYAGDLRQGQVNYEGTRSDGGVSGPQWASQSKMFRPRAQSPYIIYRGDSELHGEYGRRPTGGNSHLQNGPPSSVRNAYHKGQHLLEKDDDAAEMPKIGYKSSNGFSWSGPTRPSRRSDLLSKIRRPSSSAPVPSSSRSFPSAPTPLHSQQGAGLHQDGRINPHGVWPNAEDALMNREGPNTPGFTSDDLLKQRTPDRPIQEHFGSHAGLTPRGPKPFPLHSLTSSPSAQDYQKTPHHISQAVSHPQESFHSGVLRPRTLRLNVTSQRQWLQGKFKPFEVSSQLVGDVDKQDTKDEDVPRTLS